MENWLLIKDEKVVMSCRTRLQLEKSVREGEYIIEEKAWRIKQAEIEAHKVHMEKDGIKLIGANLSRLVRAGTKVSDEEFRYLCKHTALDGIGSDVGIEEFNSRQNLRALQKIANGVEQIKIIGEF